MIAIAPSRSFNEGIPSLDTQRFHFDQRNVASAEKTAKQGNYSRAFTVLFAALTVTACAPTHYVTKETPNYDPTRSARMRILTGNDTQGASFRPGTCYTRWWQTDPERIDVDDGYFSRFKYSSRSVTIGMPASPRPEMRVEGLRAKDLIREYVVEAGKPIALSMGRGGDNNGVSWGCSVDGSFVPAAGGDYDIYLAVRPVGRRSHECTMFIRRIDANGLDEPVQVGYASKCPTPENEPKKVAR